MEHVMAFDTLQYVKRAREAGFTEEQAEFQAEEIAKIRDEWNMQVVTKADLKVELMDLKKDLTKDLTMAMIEQELRITSKTGYMLSAAVAILGVLIAFLHK